MNLLLHPFYLLVRDNDKLALFYLLSFDLLLCFVFGPLSFCSQKRRTKQTQTFAAKIVLKPTHLSPEVEKLRMQDINPDQNSAAFRALTAASGATTDSAGTSHK